MKKETLLEQAKNTKSLSRRNGNLSDEDAIDLVIAYGRGEISGSQIAAVLTGLGFRTGGGGTTILGNRMLRILRKGMIEIRRK